MSGAPCPRIEAVLDQAFRAVVGSPCVPVAPLSPEEKRERAAGRRAEAVRLRGAGWKVEAIAAELGVTPSGVAFMLRRARRLGEAGDV